MAITYYSELKHAKDIVNPVIDNNVYMKHTGDFSSVWDENEIDFDNFGYGLERSKHGRGIIFCDNASSLFSMASGYIGLLLQFPENIENGVYSHVKNTTNNYILFGVNLGSSIGFRPSIYASLSNDGIKLSIQSSYCGFEINDIYSNIAKNTPVFLEWMWKSTGIDDFDQEETQITVNYRVNGVNLIAGNPPLANDSIANSNFSILNTPYRNNNFECIIKKIVIGDSPSINIEEELFSSSSESSESSTSS